MSPRKRQPIDPFQSSAPTDPKSVATKLLECIGANKLEGMKELFADEIDWFVPGSSDLPWTGRRTRNTQVPEFFTVMWPRYISGKSSAKVNDIISDDKNVVIIGSFSHVIKNTGMPFTTPIVLHLKVQNGKINSLHLYEDTLLISQAFGLAAGARAVGPTDLPSLQKGDVVLD